MKIILLILSLLSMLMPVHAQNRQALEKSDSLFAQGVDLYKAGQYEKAIPLFAESDRIDKAELDSASNRRNYSAMWLASCYYRLGDTVKAKENDAYFFNVEPIDRRQTIASDSLLSLAITCASEENYQDAISYLLKCVEIEKRVIREEHKWHISTLTILRDYYFIIGNYSELLVLEEKLLHLLKASFGEASVPYVKYLNNTAETLTNLGEYQQAIIHNKKALALIQENPDLYEDLKVFVLIGLADCYSQLDDQLIAIQYATEGAEFYLKAYGEKDPGYANCLARIAMYNNNIGNFKQAIDLALQAKEILLESLGEDHPDYISVLDNLSTYYTDVCEYNKAISLSREALTKTKQVEGKSSYNYATTLLHYATCCSNLGKLQEALRNTEESVSIFETLYGKEHPHYLSAVSHLANCYASLGYYSKAIKLNQEILDVTKQRYGTKNSSYVVFLKNLASFYSEIGDLKKEYELISEALQIAEKTYDKKYKNYFSILNCYAVSLCHLGDYEKAIECITQAMERQADLYGVNNSIYISMLNTLRICYEGIGNIHKIHEVLIKSLDISNVIYKDQPLNQLDLIIVSAVTCINSGWYEQAKSWAGIAQDIINENIDNIGVRNLPPLVHVMLSCLYHSEKDSLRPALKQCEYILEQCEPLLGKEHPDCLALLSDFSFCYAKLGDYAKAIELGEYILQVERKNKRDKLSFYTYCQKIQANNCFAVNDRKSVSKYACEATERTLAEVVKNFQFQTSYERTLFLEREEQWLKFDMPKMAYYIPSDSLLLSTFNSVLFGKGMLLHTDSEIKKTALESNDTAIIHLYEDILSKHKELDALYKAKDTTLYNIMDSLEDYVLHQERLLIQRSRDYGNYVKNLNIRYNDVRQRLEIQDVAIEFIRFPIKNDSIMYAALLSKQGMEIPKMIPLFEEKRLKNVSKSDFYVTSVLTDLIWQPLAEELQDVQNIYFAPDGELYNIAIESLPAWDGDGLVSDKRNFYRLTSTRELALAKDKNKISTASVYGGLKYDADEQVLINDNKKYPAKRDFTRSSIADSLNLRSGVEELPATKTEAVDIDKKLAQVKITNWLYTDTLGTEASFKALSGQKRNLLHIATHGFYWTEREAQSMDHLGFLSLANDNLPLYVEDKAMTRSGLLFAGANHALKGKPLPEGVDDGILTAKEISSLDLRGLDMIVLSACQTGLGEVTGDGVFGLQRGFKKAGANTLLMSLWKVDDKATQMLMTQFYTNLMSGKSKFESLREAQRYVREYETEVTENGLDNQTAYQKYKSERNDEENVQQPKLAARKTKPYASPRYWAAFILLDALE